MRRVKISATALAFSFDDTQLAAVGKGEFSVWSVIRFECLARHSSDLIYTAIAYDGRWILSAENHLRIYENNDFVDISGHSYSSLCVIEKTLYAAGNGELHVYALPNLITPCDSIAVDEGDGRIVVQNNRLFVSFSRSLYIAQVGKPHAVALADCVLVGTQDLTHLEDEVRSWKEQTTVLTSQVESLQEQPIEAHHQEEITHLKESLAQEKRAQTEKERDNVRILKSMESNRIMAAQKLEEIYEMKIQHDKDTATIRERELQIRLEQMQAAFDEERMGWKRKLAETREECIEKLSRKDDQMTQHRDMLSYLEHRHQTVIEQVEEEHAFVEQKTQKESQHELMEVIKANKQLRKEQDALLRGLEMLDREKEERYKSNTMQL